jgi:hypothetical protein
MCLGTELAFCVVGDFVPEVAKRRVGTCGRRSAGHITCASRDLTECPLRGERVEAVRLG